MKRLSSILAATAVCAGLASAPLAEAAQLTPQQVAGNAAQSTLAPLEVTPEPVSYTHLTLPTICSV